MKNDSLRILMIGPLHAPLGGTSVLFEELFKTLKAHPGLEVRVISTAGVRGESLKAPFRLAALTAAIMRQSRWADVVTLHGSTTDLHIIGPVTMLSAKLFRKPALVRKFGGSDYPDYAPLKRFLIHRSVSAADLYLVETNRLLDAAVARGLEKTIAFPNCRAMPPLEEDLRGDSRACRRFVFIGHMRKDKGIDLLIEAGERFDSTIVIDLYGPMRFDVSESDFNGLERVRYRGLLAPDEVMATLSYYDALVLPTYYPGEGHPGVILEAYAAGLPVVASRWLGIPEVVPESMGVLVEPRDANALFEAMQTLFDDIGLYNRLRAGVREGRMGYSDELRAEEFIDYCRKLTAS